jgi:hypothetical protein
LVRTHGGQKIRRSKSSKKKVKASVATTRSRAGPGFAFEDQIGAYLLLQMLMGEALPGTEDAIGSRLQTQTKELGWSIDDLLATSHPDAETQFRVAVSCKSSTQVSAAGLPKDFVLAAWEQWRKRGKGRIRRGRDCLMLATKDVGQAAGRERNDHADRPCRIGLRPCDTRNSRQRGSTRRQM